MPKLRLKRLIKLQAVMRGYYVRKFKIPRKKADLKILESYVDRFIKHYIEVDYYGRQFNPKKYS